MLNPNNNKSKEDLKIEKIVESLDDMKYNKYFLKLFIAMYDIEDLYKIMKAIQLEIQKRHRDNINNII